MEVFLKPCPPSLSTLISKFSKNYSLPTLPLHIHQVIYAFATYHLTFLLLSPILSRVLFPKTYPFLNARSKINWDVHVVSFVQSTFICVLALWGIFTDAERKEWEYEEGYEGALKRVFGYTVAGGAVQGFAAGYFLWDLMMSAWYLKIFGLGFLAHALSALLVFSLGFRPFVNYYAPVFILFELSSPFLNIHWFCDKVGLTGSKLQLYNGILLLCTFFCCRLLWGTYNSFLVFRDIFHIHASPPPPTINVPVNSTEAAEIDHPFKDMHVPLWLAAIYLGSNITLNCLNYFWFYRMIQTVSARFTGDAKKQGETKVEATEQAEKVKGDARRRRV
ncbi:hypothetical protein RUND412_000221 [Rhizina undulata]